MAPRLMLLLAFWGCLACNDDEERPPLYVESPSDRLLSCSDLRRADAIVNDSSILVDGEPADCGSDGLTCPLDSVAFAADACETTETAFGRCVLMTWRLDCLPSARGGAGGASGAGAPADPPAGGSPAGPAGGASGWGP